MAPQVKSQKAAGKKKGKKGQDAAGELFSAGNESNTVHPVSLLHTINMLSNRLQVGLLRLLPSPTSRRGASSAKTVRLTPFHASR